MRGASVEFIVNWTLQKGFHIGFNNLSHRIQIVISNVKNGNTQIFEGTTLEFALSNFPNYSHFDLLEHELRKGK